LVAAAAPASPYRTSDDVTHAGSGSLARAMAAATRLSAFTPGSRGSPTLRSDGVGSIAAAVGAVAAVVAAAAGVGSYSDNCGGNAAENKRA